MTNYYLWESFTHTHTHTHTYTYMYGFCTGWPPEVSFEMFAYSFLLFFGEFFNFMLLDTSEIVSERGRLVSSKHSAILLYNSYVILIRYI